MLKMVDALLLAVLGIVILFAGCRGYPNNPTSGTNDSASSNVSQGTTDNTQIADSYANRPKE